MISADSKTTTIKVKKPVPDAIKKGIQKKKEWMNGFQSGNNKIQVDKSKRFI